MRRVSLLLREGRKAEKKRRMIPPRIELGTFRVLGECHNQLDQGIAARCFVPWICVRKCDKYCVHIPSTSVPLRPPSIPSEKGPRGSQVARQRKAGPRPARRRRRRRLGRDVPPPPEARHPPSWRRDEEAAPASETMRARRSWEWFLPSWDIRDRERSTSEERRGGVASRGRGRGRGEWGGPPSTSGGREGPRGEDEEIARE